MAKRYRCLNCNTEFVADKRACAACDIDAASDKAAEFVLVPLVLIHYDPPHPKIKGKGRGHRACDPGTPIGRGRGTGEARVVNCEACKATEAYQQAVKAGALKADFLESEDEIIGIDVHGALSAEKKCSDCGKE